MKGHCFCWWWSLGRIVLCWTKELKNIIISRDLTSFFISLFCVLSSVSYQISDLPPFSFTGLLNSPPSSNCVPYFIVLSSWTTTTTTQITRSLPHIHCSPYPHSIQFICQLGHTLILQGHKYVQGWVLVPFPIAFIPTWHPLHYTRPTSSSCAPLFVTPILITNTSTTDPLHPRNDKTKSTGNAVEEEVHVI